MKVLVIGANGQIGQILIDQLQQSEYYEPIAMIRNVEQQSKFEEKGVQTVVGDLEGSVKDLEMAMQGVDAIVFTAGSGGKTGPDKTLLVDLDGASKTIEAAENLAVKRYIMVSAIQAHNRENWSEQIKPYFVAKHHADRILANSTLDFTIVRPGILVNETATGKIKIAENLERSTITRADVASTIVSVLKAENTLKKSFDLINGETEIEVAVKAFE
ncbi:uncharacterized protein YbjT (DUF2867 family) [Gracilibacillus halotolerans]|uniref:Uncharacterized protein YbjT (DUF2867 family) n=1 Tax=Gracilibacillus halotolerans TaxID=74386 RepID=A0A841RJB5_9BACI|nr:SDR family oxidoreductase [Gracilibacillus halotolerans]MBB6511576.1 uncharacterized protein YbjT (DUF2867 family) [Gracilibacillus halotolerans]